METYELLREGVWTDGDHRMITPETVTWPDDPIPVLARAKSHGTDLSLGADQALTAECNYAVAHQVSRGRVELTGVQMLAAFVSDKTSYPWTDHGDEEEKGGDPDAS